MSDWKWTRRGKIVGYVLQYATYATALAIGVFWHWTWPANWGYFH